MVRSIVLVLALSAACAAAGCRGEATSSQTFRDTSTLTGAELGWIRAYSTWTFGFYDDEPKVGSDAVEACRDEVEHIGPSPTPRLEEAASRLPAICPLLERTGSVARAQNDVERVDDLLLPFFRDEQQLQLRSGVTDRSRADVVLSGVASDAIGHPVEVRCWNEKDWARVLGEDNVWNDDDDDPDELVGWSDDSADRIHLVLDMCNTMTVAKSSDLTRWKRYERIDAIDAIETLAHEIGHFLHPDADEATTECRAIQTLPAFARRFGVTASDARELTELYRTVVYPELDDEYNRGGCPSTS